jgi:hypothetical protein
MPPTDAPRNRVPRLRRCKAPSGLGSQNRGASAHGKTNAPRNTVPRLHRCKAPWPRFSEPGIECSRPNQRPPEQSSEATQTQGSSGLGSRNRGASAHGPTDAPRNRVPRLRRRKAPRGLGSQNRGVSTHDPTNAPRNTVPRLRRCKAPGDLGSQNRGASAQIKLRQSMLCDRQENISKKHRSPMNRDPESLEPNCPQRANHWATGLNSPERDFDADTCRYLQSHPAHALLLEAHDHAPVSANSKANGVAGI